VRVLILTTFDHDEEILEAITLGAAVRVGHGDTNEEIGKALFISPATARTYVSRLLAKLHARDRTQLAVIAHRSGLTGADP
jgi:DNA-binding NarL/FixJ family response regulator